MNHKLKRTYEVIADASQLTILKTTAKGHICNCLWCASKYKPNESGSDIYPKLHMTSDMEVGFCFRCNTVVIVSTNEEVSYDEYLQRLVGQIIRNTSQTSSSSSVYMLPEIELPVTTSLSNRSLSYLMNRSAYILTFIKELEFYGCTSGYVQKNGIWESSFNPEDERFYLREGILFPFKYDTGKCFSYQVRYIDTKKPKYWLPSVQKLFYGISGLPTKHVDTITLCEGVFDVLGLRYLGYPNPLAIMGSYLSPSQLLYLKNVLTPKVINVVMDNADVNESIVNEIRCNMYTVEVIKPVVLHPKLDPDEVAFHKSLENTRSG